MGDLPRQDDALVVGEDRRHGVVGQLLVQPLQDGEGRPGQRQLQVRVLDVRRVQVLGVDVVLERALSGGDDERPDVGGGAPSSSRYRSRACETERCDMPGYLLPDRMISTRARR